MDADTGFALGGNKVRKLEYELEASRLGDATCLITAGGPQSNHCRVVAAFAARIGLRCILIVHGPIPDPPTGNALIHRLFGAEVRSVPDREAREPTMSDVAAVIEREGGRPLIVPIGASTPVGCLGYARAAVELTGQLDALGDPPERTVLFVPSSSCGTLAGIVLGLAILDRPDIFPIGVSADTTALQIRESTLSIALDAAHLVGTDTRIVGDAFGATEKQVGAGYGIPTKASASAAANFARLEGLILDPVYTAKAAAGMIAWIGENGVAPSERIVFLHTGGHPALLAG
jgi:1-aminocyclopropane-1-carboxylate deaminase/D-cysteine desulfhydrase-like pyridoxal-dependent ACC family enzyme